MPNIVIKANVSLVISVATDLTIEEVQSKIGDGELSLVLNGETWIKDVKIHTLEVEEQ